jgi:hypothetical protein
VIWWEREIWEGKKNKKETMGYQENTRNLFLISSISLEKSRQDDSNCN